MTTKYDTYVCYQCEANEVSAPVGTVHPLCSVCYEEHEDWFAQEMLLLESKVTQLKQANTNKRKGNT